MPELFIYLLKANVSLSLFYLAYRLGLRRLTFYTLNRFFLLTGIVFSSVFPLVDVNDFFNRNEKTLGTVVYYVPDLGALKPAAEAVEVFTVWTALTWVFWIGVGIMSVRLLLQMISLMRFHMMSDAAKLRNRQVRVVQREVAPFSFFKNIYLNPQLHSNDELDAVIRHEQVHVEEWHSADVMMGEINNVFYWFNPGAWLMKTAIRENLEFITDRKMLRAGVDAKAYQYSLLKVSGAPYATAIANNFNFSHLKNRIMMMNKERSSRYQIVRYVVLGCMVSMLVLTLNFSRAGVKLAPVGQGTIPQLLLQDQTEKTEPQPEKRDTVAPEVIVTGYKLKKDTGVKIFVTRSQGSADTAHRPVTFVAKSGFTMSSDTLLLSYLQKTAGSRVNENGEVVVRGYALRPDSAKSGKVENIFITSSNDKFILVGAAKGSKPVRITRSPDENYTFFLNGSPVSESALYRLERADISEVTTNVKEEGPTKIEVFTKSGSKPITLQVRNSPRVVTGNGIVFRGDTSRQGLRPGFATASANNVLMLIDGKPDSTISHLNSDQIESVTVLKDQAALAIYGSRAANGVILVQTKKGKTVKDTVVTNLIRRVQDPSLEEIVVTGMASPAPRTETIAIREKAKAETAAHQKLFRVFPNPSSTGSFNAQFQLAGDGKYEARLYNSKGVEVSRMAGDGTPGSFKTLDFVVTGAPGVYYLHVFTGGHRAAKKLIKQ